MFSFTVTILSTWSVIILKLCKSGYSVVISILVIAQGLVLNIMREEIIFLDETGREEDFFSEQS